ncbi:tyrosine-protein kinase [Saccharobesus litoralis]|uniref:Tyrosine-protein kinase n=1 Tax=Saccharobesus litoralis TaxID=2172099 RepID=A0A2S0VRA6_9ALTE|nr:polysaccharide biosynthesis tyrosine autokinase [Saccharobesus litoralis]AWB66748.1 tyrosine-protein kinase [Saccharobesus litoralis]
MNAQSNLFSNNKTGKATASQDSDEIDLSALFGALIDRKYFIAIVTAIFAALGVAYAMFSTPIYQATALIQVESKGASVPGFDDMSGMFESTSAAVTEIELLKSRTVIGEAVDNLKLHTVVEPKLFPVVGGRYYRKFFTTDENALAIPKFWANTYAWGGESIDVFDFKVPSHLLGTTFELVAKSGNQIELKLGENTVLAGVVGQTINQGEFSLTVRSLNARADTRFLLKRNDRLSTILSLQGAISASEKGKDSGIVTLSYQNKDAAFAKTVLDEVAAIYVRHNVERNSAEAKKSLDFLQVQLPEVKKQLERAEQKLNDYQKNQQSVNISLETQGVLEQIVELDTKLQELELKRLEVSRKFKREHPLYQSAVDQIKVVQRQKRDLTSKVTDLPETQQELFRLTRDVEVSNEIYMLLLSKTQELDIVRAGTVGNVRVVDSAAVDYSNPVKPKKALIAVMATMLGGILAVGIVLVQRALHKGIEDASQIEALGLPVYASVPFSESQEKLTGIAKLKSKNKNKTGELLALSNPTDLSIEALRSLRTSLHFALMDAKNHVVSISGPSPGVGKSFISANLAAVLAQSDKKVLLIDADMRKGYLQKHFNIKAKVGLSDYLSGKNTLEDVTLKTDIENLAFIARGAVPPNPSELLMHHNFSDLIEIVKEKYDLVIIDTPPILAVTDPAIVGNHAGTTLLVTRFGQNHVKEVEITQNRFEQNGVDVKGVVFNGVVKKASNAYGYYGYYNYEYKTES